MFQRCLFTDKPFDIAPSDSYIDDHWATNQEGVALRNNPGWEVLQEGDVEGTIIGSNLGTLHLLQGTAYMPDPKGDIILFIEDDYEDHAAAFDRHLQSLLHLPMTSRVRGVVVGRCEEKSGITPELLRQILETKEELRGLPVVTGVDFGHTTPLITFPIGGTASLHAAKGKASIRINQH